MKSISLLVFFIVPTLTVVSCGYESKEFIHNNINWDLFNWYDIEGLDWNDGDTFSWDKIVDRSQGAGKLDERIRLMPFDTPEMSGKGIEYELADKARIFVNKVASGNDEPVRLISVGGRDPFGRGLGTIFYKENGNYKNIGVELFKLGLARPTYDDKTIITYLEDLRSMYHYLAYPLHYNYMYAKDKKINMWKYNLDEVFAVRAGFDHSGVDKNSFIAKNKNLGYNF